MLAYIDNYRRELPVVLLNSPYNKLKSMKRQKMYNASLSDAAAIEDHEDASIVGERSTNSKFSYVSPRSI